MLSFAPLFVDSYVPALSTCNFYDFQAVCHRQPKYSIVENDSQAHLEIELPGVAKENINIDLNGNKVMITGKRFREGDNVDAGSEEKGRNDMKGDNDKEQAKPSVVYELKVGIGHRYDAENIEATMDGDGILKMVIPLKKKDRERKIEIQ